MVRQTLRMSALAVLAAFGPACGVTGEPGSGKPKSETRAVGPFSRIEIGGALNADVSVAEVHSVEVSGDDNLVPLVITEVKDGRLQIRTSKNVAPKLELLVRITVPEVAALAVSGAGQVKLREIQGDDLELDLSGAGDVAASGAVRNLDLEVSGAGTVDARNLKTERARVSVSGAGQVGVHASQTLDVDISGAGHVRYDGNPPDVRQSISGAGSLEKL